MALLEVDNVRFRYRRAAVLDGLSFAIEAGQIASLLGPSGCGKTTTLRAIMGFEDIEAGEIRVDGEVLSAAGHTVAPEHRHIGMVFQDHALFPHLDVAANIAIGIAQLATRERDSVVARLLTAVGLPHIGARYPHELSGGQQARVALARALAPQPRLILLDEPFAGLDDDTRTRLIPEVRELLEQSGTTALMVTHEQREALSLSHRIGLMRDGALLQWGAPFALYHEPASREVAAFVGLGSFLCAEQRAPGVFHSEVGVLHGPHLEQYPLGTVVDILLRPDDVQIDPTADIPATVTAKAFRGASTLYTVQLATGTELLSLVSSHRDLEVGQATRLALDLEHLVAFPRADFH